MSKTAASLDNSVYYVSFFALVLFLHLHIKLQDRIILRSASNQENRKISVWYIFPNFATEVSLHYVLHTLLYIDVYDVRPYSEIIQRKTSPKHVQLNSF
jgi:hypothetical protein